MRNCSIFIQIVSGGEELYGAPLLWMPNLSQMFLDLLEENHR